MALELRRGALPGSRWTAALRLTSMALFWLFAWAPLALYCLVAAIVSILRNGGRAA